MRKILAMMTALAIVMVMSSTVKASTDSIADVFPGLSFSGTTATCSLNVFAEHTSDQIIATVTLKRGNTTVKQWSNLSSNGYMMFSDTANARTNV